MRGNHAARNHFQVELAGIFVRGDAAKFLHRFDQAGGHRGCFEVLGKPKAGLGQQFAKNPRQEAVQGLRFGLIVAQPGAQNFELFAHPVGNALLHGGHEEIKGGQTIFRFAR